MAGALTWDPGWYSDPTGRHDHRWWDGAAWTAHVADAGIAAQDALDAPTDGPGRARSDLPATGSTASATAVQSGGVDPVTVIGLVVALLAGLLALLPILGLIPTIVAVVIAVIARSRVRRSGRKGEGIALAGLVISIGALLVAVLVTIITLSVLGGSGGELQEAFRTYADCLEVDSPTVCRTRLEQDLSRLVR